jgi:hypothetical protein
VSGREASRSNVPADRPMCTDDIDPETGEAWGVDPADDESQLPCWPELPGVDRPGVACCGPADSGEQS